MATLDAAARKHVAQSKFGLPAAPGPNGGTRGKYPMPDASHARDAEARASEEYNAGHLSAGQRAHIDSMAKSILGDNNEKAHDAAK